MRTLLTVPALLLIVLSPVAPLVARPAVPQGAVSNNCVTLTAPKPGLSFTYRYADSNKTAVEFSNRWEQFTATGSRLVTTKAGGAGTSEYVSRHQVVDDVFVLEASTAVGTDAGGPFKNSMSYTPGAIGDPAFRACTGRTWKIPTVSMASQSLQGAFSARTDPGTLTIVSINESVTVPAGTFPTVRYIKTMTSSRGSLVDEFWKSIEHGVTVKRTFRQPGAIGEEVLVAIK